MDRLILVLIMVGSLLIITGCVTTDRVYYAPRVASTHTPSYTHPVKYYHTSPYWDVDYFSNDYNSNNDAYYYGYDDLGDAGYWGMYSSYQVY